MVGVLSSCEMNVPAQGRSPRQGPPVPTEPQVPRFLMEHISMLSLESPWPLSCSCLKSHVAQHREIAQSGKYLVCEHEDPNWTPEPT